MSRPALIFDLGGVFYRIHKPQTMQALRGLVPEAIRPSFPTDFDSFCEEPAVLAFETGQMGPHTFRNHFREVWQSDCSDADFDAAWNALLLGPDAALINSVSPLLQGSRAFVLSTNNPIHYAQVSQELDAFLDQFEKCYFSHQTGLRKPDANAFEQILNENGIAPAHAVFVDDGALHVAAAECMGIRSHRFTDERGLRSFLQSLT